MKNNYQLEDNEEYTTSKFQEFYNSNKGLVWVLIIVLAFIFFALIFTSCSNRNNTNNNNNNQEEKITFDFDNDIDSVMIGSSKKITASLSNNKNDEIEYSTSNKNIIDVDKYGLVEGISLGNAKLKATYKDSSGNEHVIERKITVFEGNKNITINDVSFPDGVVLLKLHDSYNLGNKLDVDPISGYIEKKIFKSSNSSIVSVDEKGKIIALSTGEATISVSINDIHDSSIKVYVLDESINSGIVRLPDKISFTKDSMTLKVGEKEKVRYELTPNSSTGDYLIWKSSNPSIATVNSNGEVEAIKIGKCEINLSTINGKSAKLPVEVISNIVDVESIVVSPDPIKIKENETYYLTPQVSPSNATDKTLSFSSSNNNIASVRSSDGINGIIYGYKEGKANITITSTNGKTVSVRVIVSSNDSGSVSSNDGSVTVRINGSITPAKTYSNDIVHTDPANISITKSGNVKTVKYCYAPYTSAICTPNVTYTNEFRIPSGNLYRLRIQKFDGSNREIVGSNNDNYRNGALEYYVNTRSDNVYKDIGYTINGIYYETLAAANSNIVSGNYVLDFELINTVTDKIKVCYTTGATCNPDTNPNKVIERNTYDKSINLNGNGLWKIRVSEYSSNEKVGITKTYYLKIQNNNVNDSNNNNLVQLGYTMTGNYYETMALANNNSQNGNQRIRFAFSNNVTNKLKICVTKNVSCNPDTNPDKMITTNTISKYVDLASSGLWKIYVSEYKDDNKIGDTKEYFVRIN